MLSLTRSSADLISSFLLKWAIPTTAMWSSSAMSLSGVSTPRTSVAERPSTLPTPRYALTGSMITSTTLPMRSIALRRSRRSVTRLKVLSTPPTRAPLTKWTRLGSARAAIERGRTVSRSPSSALNQITLPCGALSLAHVGQAGNQPELASGKTAGPQPVDAAHFEIGGLANYEPVFPLRLSLGNDVFGYQVDIVVYRAFSIWKRAP